MNYSREKDNIAYTLGSMQARLFEKSSIDNIPSYFFIQQFMQSEDAKMIDDLSFLQTGSSELEIYMHVKQAIKRKKGVVYSAEIMHWMGFFYRYAAYLTSIDSKTLFKRIPPKKLYEMYPLYHGLDIQKAIEMVMSAVKIDQESPMDRFLNLYHSKKILL